MLNYLKIYRPLNLLFIAAAQLLAGYYLNFAANFTTLLKGNHHWFIIGTAACAAFGYWINDFYDKERDAINKTEQKFIHKLNPYLVYIHVLAFVSLALYAGNQLGAWFFMLFLVTIVSLLVYGIFLKNIAGIGNFLIAALCFISIYAISELFVDVDRLLIIHFSTLAGMITLAREIVKDSEDLEGDRLTRGKTLPIIVGLRNSNLLVYVIILFTMSFMIVSLYYQNQFLAKPLIYVYYAYYLLFVVIPLYKVAIDIRVSNQKMQYAYFSKILKYVMFTGILSILFF
jgi:4-hydroxybenzoate polyprenyltransferase